MTKLSESEQEKIALEHQAAKLFLRLYEKRFHTPMRHIWHNKPIKPDVSCYLDNEKLDLEIAHLYGSSEEAMAILGRELSTQTRAALDEQLLLPATERLNSALNKILSNKAKKRYQSHRVWLVIRNANPYWHIRDIKRFKASWQSPLKHPFEQIWLVCDFAGKSGILRLYPD